MELSIVIAVFNQEKFLRSCLDSVRSCPSGRMECIMVNDGSTDATRAICEEFAHSDDRFKLINKENSGVSDSRNAGMRAASGAYIFFIDADDYLDAACWPDILAQAEAGRYDMIAYGYYSLFPSGATQKELYPDYAEKNQNTGADVRHALMSTTLLNTCWGKLLRRQVIEKNNLCFRSQLKTCEDAIFIIDFVQRASTFRMLNQCVLFYRIHENSAMRQYSLNDKLDDFTQLFRRRNEYLALYPGEGVKTQMYRQCFSILTDMFRRCAAVEGMGAAKAAYRQCLTGKQVVRDIMENTDKGALSPFYKRLEYDWIRSGRFAWLAFYFKLKSRVMKA